MMKNHFSYQGNLSRVPTSFLKHELMVVQLLHDMMGSCNRELPTHARVQGNRSIKKGIQKLGCTLGQEALQGNFYLWQIWYFILSNCSVLYDCHNPHNSFENKKQSDLPTITWMNFTSFSRSSQTRDKAWHVTSFPGSLTQSRGI